MGEPGSDLSFVPPTFALLTYPDDELTPSVVAWGMGLPDGSVFAVGSYGESAGSMARCSSAERAAFIYDADVVWSAGAAPEAHEHESGRSPVRRPGDTRSG